MQAIFAISVRFRFWCEKQKLDTSTVHKRGFNVLFLFLLDLLAYTKSTVQSWWRPQSCWMMRWVEKNSLKNVFVNLTFYKIWFHIVVSTSAPSLIYTQRLLPPKIQRNIEFQAVTYHSYIQEIVIKL
jgi:hypothetical protein